MAEKQMSEYDTKVIRRRITVYGHVQGVGFRYRARHAADAYGVTGWVCNNADGSVSMELQGAEQQIDQVFLAIERGTYVRIENMDSKTIPVEEDEYSFRIRESSDFFGSWHRWS